MSEIDSRKAESSIIASRVNRNASAIVDMNLKKMYKRKPTGAYSFFYAMGCDLDNISITELNLLGDMLSAEFQNDYPLYFEDSLPTMEKVLETKINREHSMVYLYFELKFEKEWTAPSSFKEA